MPTDHTNEKILKYDSSDQPFKCPSYVGLPY